MELKIFSCVTVFVVFYGYQVDTVDGRPTKEEMENITCPEGHHICEYYGTCCKTDEEICSDLTETCEPAFRPEDDQDKMCCDALNRKITAEKSFVFLCLNRLGSVKWKEHCTTASPSEEIRQCPLGTTPCYNGTCCNSDLEVCSNEFQRCKQEFKKVSNEQRQTVPSTGNDESVWKKVANIFMILFIITICGLGFFCCGRYWSAIKNKICARRKLKSVPSTWTKDHDKLLPEGADCANIKTQGDDSEQRNEHPNLNERCNMDQENQRKSRQPTKSKLQKLTEKGKQEPSSQEIVLEAEEKGSDNEIVGDCDKLLPEGADCANIKTQGDDSEQRNEHPNLNERCNMDQENQRKNRQPIKSKLQKLAEKGNQEPSLGPVAEEIVPEVEKKRSDNEILVGQCDLNEGCNMDQENQRKNRQPIKSKLQKLAEKGNQEPSSIPPITENLLEVEGKRIDSETSVGQCDNSTEEFFDGVSCRYPSGTIKRSDKVDYTDVDISRGSRTQAVLKYFREKLHRFSSRLRKKYHMLSSLSSYAAVWSADLRRTQY